MSPSRRGLYEEEVRPLLELLRLKELLSSAQEKAIRVQGEFLDVQEQLCAAVESDGDEDDVWGCMKDDADGGSIVRLEEKADELAARLDKLGAVIDDMSEGLQVEEATASGCTLFEPLDDPSDENGDGNASQDDSDNPEGSRTDCSNVSDSERSSSTYAHVSKKQKLYLSIAIGDDPSQRSLLGCLSPRLMASVVSFLPCTAVLEGLGTAGKAARCAVISTITTMHVRRGVPVSWLTRFPSVSRLRILDAAVAGVSAKEIVGWFAELVECLGPRLESLEAGKKLLGRKGEFAWRFAAAFFSRDWPKLTHLQTPYFGSVLNHAISGRRPCFLRALKTVNLLSPITPKLLSKVRRAKARGCLPRLRSLRGRDGAPLQIVVRHPGDHLLALASVPDTDGLHLRLKARERQVNGQVIVHKILEALGSQDCTSKLSCLRLKGRLGKMREVLQGLSKLDLASAITRLHIHISGGSDNSSWQLKRGCFASITALHITSNRRLKGIMALLNACGGQLAKLHISSTGKRSPALSRTLLSKLASPVMFLRPRWTLSVKALQLPPAHPKKHGQAQLVVAMREALMQLPSLVHLTLSDGHDGTVVGLIEALQSGGLPSLSRVQFMMEEGQRTVRRGAGLLLFAWLKRERGGLARALMVQNWWESGMVQTMIFTVGLTSIVQRLTDE